MKKSKAIVTALAASLFVAPIATHAEGKHSEDEVKKVAKANGWLVCNNTLVKGLGVFKGWVAISKIVAIDGAHKKGVAIVPPSSCKIPKKIIHKGIVCRDGEKIFAMRPAATLEGDVFGHMYSTNGKWLLCSKDLTLWKRLP